MASSYFARALTAFVTSVSFSSPMMRSIDCQSAGSQTVPLKPAVVVIVPGKSEIASSLPPIERLDQARSQTSQKLPLLMLSPLGAC